MLGVDYSSGFMHPLRLKAAGVVFVARYLSTPGNTKNLTNAEVARMKAAGVHIVTVFETTATRALQGNAAGKVDARSAVAQLASLGAPKDAPIYFAVDFDATPGEQTAINNYFKGVRSVVGTSRKIGGYGGFYTVKRLFDAGLIDYGWQTRAWSGNQWDKRAHIRQTHGGMLDGISVDFDYAQFPDFGQWDRPAPPKPPNPPVKPVVFPVDDSFWTWVRWRTGTGEFAPYGKRNPDVRPNVPQRIPSKWWAALKYFMSKNPSEVT